MGADKGYDTRDFVTAPREMNVLPHVSQNNNGRRSAIDARTTRHESYLISQKKRPLIERTFGWMKAIAGLRKVKLRGLKTWTGCSYYRGRLQSVAYSPPQTRRSVAIGLTRTLLNRLHKPIAAQPPASRPVASLRMPHSTPERSLFNKLMAPHFQIGCNLLILRVKNWCPGRELNTYGDFLSLLFSLSH
jgi:hypothetical protein